MLSLLLLVRLTLRWAWPVVPRPFAKAVKVDLNVADVPTLMTLPGVGRRRAAAIVLHRVRHGRFHRAEEVLEVEGFGATGLARLRPCLQPLTR